MMQLKSFQEKSFHDLEEKFNFWMDAAKPKQIYNVSYHNMPDKEPAITVLWDDGITPAVAAMPPHIVIPGRGRN